jgi:glycosyltransferase involved in cell wall biosynthesis
MKIIHLSSSNDGGAGIAAYRLHTSMRKQGMDSSMHVLYRKGDDPSVRLVSTVVRPCLLSQSGMSPHFGVSNMRWNCLMAQHPERPQGLEMFSDASSDVVLEEIDELRRADIIHLHWVAGMVDYGRLGHVFRGKKVVWTLHDMNPFTGGCHYAGNCNKYRTECETCPQLGKNPHLDYARYIFWQKFYGIKELDVTVTAPSRWLAGCARNSAVFATKSVCCIPNGVPVEIFRQSPREPVKKLLGIPMDHNVLLFGAFSVHNQRKGFSLLLAALHKMPIEILSKVTLVFFGQTPSTLSLQLPCNIKGLGSITNEENLAMIYSMADLFVIPSTEDNLPNTVLESLACGTPVVGFRIGGIPDMIDHQKTGYLVEPFDTGQLASGILWCINNRNLLSRDTCSQIVRYGFNAQIQAQRYLSLYRTLT